MNKQNVAVIVVKCTPNNGESRSTYGDRLVDKAFGSVPDAINFVERERHQRQGNCVIIRPNYNEEDSRGRYFREWRSFNGEQFRECRWEF